MFASVLLGQLLLSLLKHVMIFSVMTQESSVSERKLSEFQRVSS